MASTHPRAWAATGFAAGTFVQTARGLRPIERLQPGVDELEFRDGTTGPLKHLHIARFTAEELADAPEVRPMRIPALTLGGTVPERPLIASRDIRIHAQGRLVGRVTEKPEVLMPAEALLAASDINAVTPDAGMTYYHLVTDDHQVLRVEGLMCETLFLGEDADPQLREEITAAAGPLDHAPLFPRIDLETAARLTAKLARKNRAPTTADS